MGITGNYHFNCSSKHPADYAFDILPKAKQNHTSMNSVGIEVTHGKTDFLITEVGLSLKNYIEWQKTKNNAYFIMRD